MKKVLGIAVAVVASLAAIAGAIVVIGVGKTIADYDPLADESDFADLDIG